MRSPRLEEHVGKSLRKSLQGLSLPEILREVNPALPEDVVLGPGSESDLPAWEVGRRS